MDIFKVSVAYYDVPSPVVLIPAEPDALPYKAKDAAVGVGDYLLPHVL